MGNEQLIGNIQVILFWAVIMIKVMTNLSAMV